MAVPFIRNNALTLLRRGHNYDCSFFTGSEVMTKVRQMPWINNNGSPIIRPGDIKR